MKKSTLAQVFFGSSVAVIAGLASVSPSQARGQTSFVCSTNGGVPATVAQTPSGNVTIIKWTSNYFTDAGFNQLTRCQMVSDRFQRYHEMGKLDYLTTGRINRQPVVCVTNTKDGDCANESAEGGLLFTLKSSSDPGDTLQRLLRIRVRASAAPLSESVPRVYVDMKCLLKANGVSAEYEKCSGSQSVSPQSSTTLRPESSPASPIQPTKPTPAADKPIW
jgi:hypothetical protein